MCISHDPAFPLPGSLPTGNQFHMYARRLDKKTKWNIIIARKWKWPKGPPVMEWINMQCTHVTECNSAVKRDKPNLCSWMLLDLRNTIPSFRTVLAIWHKLFKHMDTNSKQHYTFTMGTCACVQMYLKSGKIHTDAVVISSHREDQD